MPLKLLSIEELGDLPLIERAQYAETLKKEAARISYAISHPESKLAYAIRGKVRPPKRSPRKKVPKVVPEKTEEKAPKAVPKAPPPKAAPVKRSPPSKVAKKAAPAKRALSARPPRNGSSPSPERSSQKAVATIRRDPPKQEKKDVMAPREDETSWESDEE